MKPVVLLARVAFRLVKYRRYPLRSVDFPSCFTISTGVAIATTAFAGNSIVRSVGLKTRQQQTRCVGLKIVRAINSRLQHVNGLLSIIYKPLRCFTFADTLKIDSEYAGNFTASMVETAIWSVAVINGTAIKPSQSESVLFPTSTTACAAVRKSTPSIASNAKFSTTQNVHGIPKPAILMSAIISAITGIGVESAATNLLLSAFGLTV
jgi:hypothetical protein